MSAKIESAFGSQVRQHREALGLTRKELAHRVGCSIETIRKIESGERHPSRQVAELLATHLDITPDQQLSFVQSARAKSPQGNLPAQLTSFIGRQDELAELTTRIKMTRLLTLTGSGGVGKSRLALEVASTVDDEFADGVWLVEFAPIADAQLVIQAAAGVLGVTEQPGASLMDLVLIRLRSWHALLIFDNCEHLVGACAALAERLLRTCPNLHILATSREPLRIAGEVTWRVPSLRIPDLNHLPPLEELLDTEAVQLFVERACCANQPQFEVTARSATAVAQICHRLDGIPLAIELAAARVNTLSIEQIAARLDDRFGLLTSGSRTALLRHQTLRAAIAWSFDLLTPPERKLLIQLSVFAGGFAADAVEAISDQPNTLDLLSNLVDKSLVIADVRGEAARYRLLGTIRQFALKQLCEKGEEDAARDRHLGYFLKLAEAAEIGMRGEELHKWSIRLEQDLDNLRAALTWSDEAGKFETGLRLAGALWLFWCVQDHAREGLAWVDKLLEVSSDASASTSVRAKVLYGAVMMAWRTGEWRRPETLARESLSLSRELKDPIGVALSLTYLGWLAEVELTYQRAHDMFEEALSLLRAAQHVWGVGLVTLYLVQLLMVQGEFAKAETALEENLSLFRTLDWWFLYYALYVMVGAALAQDNLRRAKALAQQRLALGRENGQTRMCCRALRELGHVALQEGDYDRATELFEECIALFRKAGYIEPHITHALADLGFIPLLQGDYETAAQRFSEAWAYYQEIGSNDSIGHAQVCLGYTLMAQGDQASAQMRFQEGLKQKHRVGHMGGIAVGLAGIGWVSQAQGNMQRAVKLCGFAAKFSGLVRVWWMPVELAGYERILADARARLDKPELAAAWAEGQAMTVDQAVEYALSE